MKYGFHIGINYTGSQYQLGGCENDAKEMRNRARAGVKSYYITQFYLATNVCTAGFLLDAIAGFARMMKKSDTLYLTFSGHGTQIPGNEADGMQEGICLWTGSRIQVVKDTDLRAQLQKIPGTVVCIFDSCFSGGMERDLPIPGKKAKCLTYDPASMEVFNVPQSKDAAPVSGNRLYYLLACSEGEVSWDTGSAGLFTKSFCRVYDKATLKNRMIKRVMQTAKLLCIPDQTPKYEIYGGNASKRIL